MSKAKEKATTRPARKGARQAHSVPKKRGTKARSHGATRGKGIDAHGFQDGDQIMLIFRNGDWRGRYIRGDRGRDITVLTGLHMGFHLECYKAAKELSAG